MKQRLYWAPTLTMPTLMMMGFLTLTRSMQMATRLTTLPELIATLMTPTLMTMALMTAPTLTQLTPRHSIQ